MENQIFTLNLTGKQVNTIIDALGEIPIEDSVGLIQQILQQFNNQLNPVV